MKEELLKSIAYPSLIFYAPFGLTIINLLFGIVGILYCISFSYIGYVWVPIIGIMIIHAILILVAKKEPHIDNLLRARSNIKVKTKNMIKENGNKFTP